MICPIQSEVSFLKWELPRLRIFWMIRMDKNVQDHCLRFSLLEDVKGNRGGAKESCKGVPAKVLHMAAIGVEQLGDQWEGALQNLVSIMSEHLLPLGTKHYSSTSDSYEEAFDAPVEVFLLYLDIKFSCFFLLFQHFVFNIRLQQRFGSHLFLLIQLLQAKFELLSNKIMVLLFSDTKLLCVRQLILQEFHQLGLVDIVLESHRRFS